MHNHSNTNLLVPPTHVLCALLMTRPPFALSLLTCYPLLPLWKYDFWRPSSSNTISSNHKTFMCLEHFAVKFLLIDVYVCLYVSVQVHLCVCVCVCFLSYEKFTEDKERCSSHLHVHRILAISTFWWVIVLPRSQREKKKKNELSYLIPSTLHYFPLTYIFHYR